MRVSRPCLLNATAILTSRRAGLWELQTDDTLPFRNSLLGEYALLMAAPPLGLGLNENEVAKIAKMGMEARFRPPEGHASVLRN